MPKLTVREWQDRLQERFLCPPQELEAVRSQEDSTAEELCSTLQGHRALLDSFHEFFLRTFRLVRKPDPEEPKSEEWWLLLLEFLTAFRSWRAAERIFRSGYPLAGFVLLRDLKDRAVILCAVGHGMSTLRQVQGHEAIEVEDAEIGTEIKKLRKREEWRIRDLIVGDKSGLSPQARAEIAEWQEMFHTEVHGARLTQTEFLPWLKGEEPLTLGPRARESSGSAYTNRAAEVGWMWTRLFPLLQTGQGFGTQWASDWRVLDDSFRYMVVTLKELEKPGLTALVDAMCELLAEEFAFDADARFPGS